MTEDNRSEDSECDHEYQHLETIRTCDNEGGYSLEYKRIDRFFCRRCLDQREIVKRDWCREKPEWY